MGEILELDMNIDNPGYTPEQRLWAEALRQAMKDAIKNDERFIQERRWFRRRSNCVRSFRWVLSVLNLEGSRQQILEVVFGQSEFAEHCRYWLCRDRGGHRNRILKRKVNDKYRHIMRAA